MVVGAARCSARGENADGQPATFEGVATHVFEKQDDGSLELMLHTFDQSGFHRSRSTPTGEDQFVKRRTAHCASLVPLLAFGGSALAEEMTLECRLYMAESTEDSSVHESEPAGRLLGAFRRGSVCVFADGSVADKQFVDAYTASADGATGVDHGFSVYTFEEGDTLTLAYDGGWDENGYRGEYEVLGGTGAYEGASGTGKITGVQSPWKGTGIVDIAIDVTVPDS